MLRPLALLALVAAFTPFAPFANGQAPGDAPALAPEVADWLARGAPIDPTADPDADDLAPLRALVGDARLVALGEATHGSHELFAFKARVFRDLATRLGFRVFAMETGFADALDVDRWLASGEGSLEDALTGLAEPWRTEEYRELLRWMRAWNADPAHAEKLHLVGLDPQIHAGQAAERLEGWMERVDPETAALVAPSLERLGALAELDPVDLDALLGVVDELRERADPEEWQDQRQLLVVLEQRYRAARERGPDALSFRDRCMADNARWILRRHPGARVVLSAHDGHVSRAGLFVLADGRLVESLGHALAPDARALPDEDLSLVVIGSAFGRGSFDAYPPGGGALRTFRIDAPPPESHEALLAQALSRPTLLDLAGAPAGAVREWLARPRLHLGPGGAWDPSWIDEPGRLKRTTLPAEYDALLFVPEVTAARRL